MSAKASSTSGVLRVPALTLHDVHRPGDPPPAVGEPFYCITLPELESLVAHLAKSGYQTVSSQAVRAWQQGKASLPGRPIVFTFDDGYFSHAQLVAPLLARHNFIGTFFVTTDFVGRPGYITRDELKGLAQRGMEIGSHGHTHRRLTELDDRELADELSRSRAMLHAVLGFPVDSIAAPGGFWDARVSKAALRAGYDAAWVSVQGLNTRCTPPLALRRIAVHQPLSVPRLMALVEGRPSTLWPVMARQAVIESAKSVLGVSGYERLKATLAPRRNPSPRQS